MSIFHLENVGVLIMGDKNCNISLGKSCFLVMGDQHANISFGKCRFVWSWAIKMSIFRLENVCILVMGDQNINISYGKCWFFGHGRVVS